MATTNLNLLSEFVHQMVSPLDARAPNLDSVLSAIGTCPYVFLGEASHGTHEFYRIRGEITKRLIREKGFRTIAIEADWPDTARVNRYIQGTGDDEDAVEALSGFQRFPSWMWRNADFLDFVGWLRHHNDSLPPGDKIEIFGLDLYSLHASMAAVIDYLEKVDPGQAQRARARYACFDMFGGDSQAYGYAAGLGLSHTCELEVVAQLVELRERAARLSALGNLQDSKDLFSAEQNALVVKNAEEYYRTMFFGDVSSWNLRDSHMAETFERLLGHRQTTCSIPKVVVWAHNSHVGDARATQMGRQGEHNIGQLLRTKHPGHCFHVGFTTYEGTVTAADAWDSAPRSMKIRQA
ncbi:MAG TPA: erythromycin esterase family protein, partial [Bryobacteraceae bacterium]